MIEVVELIEVKLNQTGRTTSIEKFAQVMRRNPDYETMRAIANVLNDDNENHREGMNRASAALDIRRC